MNRMRLALLLPALALGGGLAACAPYPAEGYYSVPPAQPGAPIPMSYRNDRAVPYATPAPGYAAPGYAQPGTPYAAVGDSYCHEAYANAVGTQQQAAVSGSYGDAARAERSAGFFRRDC